MSSFISLKPATVKQGPKRGTSLPPECGRKVHFSMAKFTLVTEPADIALLMSTFQPVLSKNPWVLRETAPVLLVTTIWENDLKFEIWGFDTEPSESEIAEISGRRNLLHTAVVGRVDLNDFLTLAHLIGEHKIAEQFLVERETRREFFLAAPRR